MCSQRGEVQVSFLGPWEQNLGGGQFLEIICSHGEGVLPVKESRFEQASMLCIKDIGFSRLHTDLKFKKKKMVLHWITQKTFLQKQ